MALNGFEILHSTVAASVKSLDDAAIAVIHWNLISNGLKCCGSGDSWSSDADTQGQCGSELLPEGWNSDGTVYSLRYIDPTSDRKYLLKVVSMDGSLITHLIRCFDEKTVSTNIRSRDFVNDQFSSYKHAYTNLKELNSQVTKELYDSIMDKNPSSKGKTLSGTNSSTSTSSSTTDSRQPGRSPLMVEDPRRGVPPGGIGFIPPRNPFGAGAVDPFGVGRADLDPLSGGLGGGMMMDPRGFPRPGGGFGPGGPLGPAQPGFPPGSVPPGARFDPVGPPGLRTNPDPDHERPPGYDDMFM